MKKIILFFFTITFLTVFTFSCFSEDEIIRGSAGTKIKVDDIDTFNEPWAMVFISDTELLITEKPGKLYLYNIETKNKQEVSGLPTVAYGGQGGLGDIVLHPDFENNKLVYLSYAEKGLFAKRGAVVARAELYIDRNNAFLEDLKVIWEQEPKVSGTGHYSHRIVFDSEGFIYIASGERQKQEPAQDWEQNLGKIIRLNADGSVPADNPFQNNGELAKTFWTLGHRNILGIAFDEKGQLWAHEMGPKHGDEFNRIIKGENYGWPIVSWGNQYSGIKIPDHDTRPDFYAPDEYWVPSIAPSGLIIYNGDLFDSWQNDAIIGGLVSESLIRVKTDGDKAYEVERFNMDKRIREVEQAPDGSIFILEDKAGARLRRITAP